MAAVGFLRPHYGFTWYDAQLQRTTVIFCFTHLASVGGQIEDENIANQIRKQGETSMEKVEYVRYRPEKA